MNDEYSGGVGNVMKNGGASQGSYSHNSLGMHGIIYHDRR
jgi:hypothetical protein